MSTSKISIEQTTPKSESIKAVKPIDSYFTVEHQSMIAAKYRAKYCDAEQSAAQSSMAGVCW